MRKLLLTFTLSIIGFIGFSSASFSLSAGGDGYIPDTVTFDTDTTIYPSYLSYNGYGSLTFFGSPGLNNGVGLSSCTVYNYLNVGGDYSYFDSLTMWGESYDGQSQYDGYCFFPAGVYSLSTNGDAFSSISLGSSNNSGGSDTGSGSGIILDGGIIQLIPIINSIFSFTGEFIPYVVYISIGILLVTLGFYAVKWLMNWLSIKITKYFK